MAGKKLSFLCFLFLLLPGFFARPLLAQVPARIGIFYMEGDGGEAVFIHHLVWNPVRYSSRYEVIVEKEEGSGYREFVREIREEAAFFEYSFTIGKYRYEVIPYDLFGRPGPASDWEYFEIFPAAEKDILNRLQRLSGTPVENASYYEAVVEREINRAEGRADYEEALRVRREDPELPCFLPPGRYRYTLISFDSSGRPGPVPAWNFLEIAAESESLGSGGEPPSPPAVLEGSEGFAADGTLADGTPGDAIPAPPETPAGLEERKTPPDYTFFTAFAPLQPVSNMYLDDLFGSDFFRTAALLSFSSTLIKGRLNTLSWGFSAAWTSFSQGDYLVTAQFMELRAFVSCYTWAPNFRMAIGVHFGAGSFLLWDFYFRPNNSAPEEVIRDWYPSLSGGISMRFLPDKTLFFELGIEYCYIFFEKGYSRGFTSGFSRPFLGMGFAL